MLMPNTPDVSSLDLLLSVNELGSLGQAAHRHCISQPAVSAKMNQLERQLALILLSRDKKGTKLTPAGQQVVSQARKVLAEMEALLKLARTLRADQDGHLRVAASFTVAEYLLGAWMERLTERRQNLSVTLEVGNSSKVLTSVAEMSVDIGFVEGVDVDRSIFDSAVVGSDQLVVLVDPTHNWARRKKAVSAQELANTEILTREIGSGTRRVLEGALSSMGGLRFRSELGSTTAILRATRTGGGPAVLSRIAATDDIMSGRLVEINVQDIELSREFLAVWKKNISLTEQAHGLLGIAQSHVAQNLS